MVVKIHHWGSILYLILFIKNVECTDVTLNYTANNFTDGRMPREVNVTFNTEENTLTHLNLRRDDDFSLDIPIYTLNLDAHGQMLPLKEEIDLAKGVSFYHDVQNMAVFQISRPDIQKLTSSKLIMTGHFERNGSIYSINQDTTTNRRSLRQSSDTIVSTYEDGKVTAFDEDIYVIELINGSSTRTFGITEAGTEMKTSARNKLNVHLGDDIRIIPKPSGSVPLDRLRRAGIKDYYLDVVGVVDYVIYRRFLTAAGQQSTQALRNILLHYAYVYSGMNMMFKAISKDFTIHIRLSKVYVLQTSSAASFIESIATSVDVPSRSLLEAFRLFSIGVGYNILKGYDHAMLFTGYKMYELSATNQKSYLISRAYVDTMCNTDGTSTSVTWAAYGYESMYNGIYSLGASLSAKLVESSVACGQSKENNPVLYLTCNVNYIQNFLQKSVLTSNGYKCLAYAQSVNSDIPDVSDKFLGQLVKPDQQCYVLYGGNSYYCRDVESNVTVSDICHSMYCSGPQDDTMCYRDVALPGTSCGDGKVCINRKCVSDIYAPQVDESCMFGDVPWIFYTSITCDWLVKNMSYMCYDTYVNKACCKSCHNILKAVRGCEYGNHVAGCSSINCTLNSTSCCDTCQAGIPYTPTTTTRRSTPPSHRTTVRPGCVLGDSDREPTACTSRDICLTSPEKCCQYCSMPNYFNNSTRFICNVHFLYIFLLLILLIF